MDDTDWDIYCICQVSSKDNIHSSTDGYKTLMKKIQSFNKKESLISILREFVTLIRNYYQFWQKIKSFITIIVSWSISDLKLKCFNEPSKKWKCTEDEKGRKSTRFSAESRERFDLFCCWCSKKDFDANLVPWYEHIRQQN